MDRDRPIVERAVIVSLLLIGSFFSPAPAGETRLALSGGLTVVRIQLPGIEVFPALSGDLELAHGLFDGVDLRGRYTTHLGLVHRLGPELRASIFSAEDFELITRLFPSMQMVGAAQRGFDIGGDVSTLFAIGAAFELSSVRLFFEAGATMEWILFEQISGRAHVDATPYLAFADFSASLEWASSEDSTLFTRLELAYSLTPDDPFTLFGFVPRVLFGVDFGL